MSPRPAEWLLDPDVAYLNHGAFGACPRSVFETYQTLQRELERQPTAFQNRVFAADFATERQAIGDLIGAAGDDVVLVPNATAGLNAVLRSLRLKPEDEVVTTDQEYGALVKTLAFTGVTLRTVVPEELVEALDARTRVVFLSHITSPTARVLDVAGAAAAAHAVGALAIIDGAHGPGQLPIDVAALDADVYVGNCHKWLCAPKSSGFLWARPEHQRWIAPIVVSWGWDDAAAFGARHGWQGTRDPAAFLAIPAAIDAHGAMDWAGARALTDEAAARLARAGYPPVGGEHAPCMVAVELPRCDAAATMAALADRYGVIVPVFDWNDRTILRVSCAPYTTSEHLDRLLEAIAAVGPADRGTVGATS